jgi:hypothetical protein
MMCPACKRKFTSSTAFDAHRTGDYRSGRKCADPATLGMTVNNGYWSLPPRK